MEFLVSDSKVSKIYQSTFLPKKRIQMMFCFSQAVYKTGVRFPSHPPLFVGPRGPKVLPEVRVSKPSAGAPGAVTGLTGGGVVAARREEVRPNLLSFYPARHGRAPPPIRESDRGGRPALPPPPPHPRPSRSMFFLPRCCAPRHFSEDFFALFPLSFSLSAPRSPLRPQPGATEERG